MVEVREATADDRPAVANVLDGAMLDVDLAVLDRQLAAGSVLVAVEDDRVLGACVVVPGGADGDPESGAYLEAIAVRRRRRGQGIGTALVEAARERWGRLTADFDGRVREFYESVGFDVTAREEVGSDDGQGGRFRGVLG